MVVPAAPLRPDAACARTAESVVWTEWPSEPDAVVAVAADIAAAEAAADLRPELVAAVLWAREVDPELAFAPDEVTPVAVARAVAAAPPFAPELVADELTARVVDPELFFDPEAMRPWVTARAVDPDLEID